MKNTDLLNIIDIPNLTHETLNYHLGVLCESNFIEATELRVFGGDRTYIIRNITQSGHNFLDVIREQSIWEIIKNKAIKAGDYALPVLIEYGLEGIKKAFSGS